MYNLIINKDNIMRIFYVLLITFLLSACAVSPPKQAPKSRIVTGQELINNMIATCASIGMIAEKQVKGTYQMTYNGCIADSKAMYRKYTQG